MLVRICELRKVGDESPVEKAHVINAACSDEFLQDREFEPDDAGECHDNLDGSVSGMTSLLALRRESYKRSATLIKP